MYHLKNLKNLKDRQVQKMDGWVEFAHREFLLNNVPLS